ncbi:MAG: hypothetical protein AAGE52_25390, partial [Myxococcota bacterium]
MRILLVVSMLLGCGGPQTSLRWDDFEWTLRSYEQDIRNCAARRRSSEPGFSGSMKVNVVLAAPGVVRRVR